MDRCDPYLGSATTVTIGLLYVGLLGGLVWAIFSVVAGFASDLGGHFDVDASGHLDGAHLHPISGTTIATFITSTSRGTNESPALCSAA